MENEYYYGLKSALIQVVWDWEEILIASNIL